MRKPRQLAVMHDEALPQRDSQLTRGGKIPGGDGQPAFELRTARGNLLPVLIAVPHAGRIYPRALVDNMRRPAEASLRLEDRFVDLIGQAAARAVGASLIVAHAPRAMIDLNRAPDDMDWNMVSGDAGSLAANSAAGARYAAGKRARSGLGLVPRRLPGMGELWKRKISTTDLAERISAVHRPYHAACAQKLEQLRDIWGAALLIDLHSMPPLGPKTGFDPAPDFVIGDRFGASCGGFLSGAALDHFELAGRRTGHNRPYAGGYMLDRHGAPARGLHAVQLEICRSAYLDDALREPGAGMAGVVEVVSGFVRRLADEIADGLPLAQAAE